MAHDARVSATIGKKTFYYGWVVVACTLVSGTAVSATQFSFGVFFKPLQDSLDWTRATTAWVISANMLIYALFMIPAGWITERSNIRALLGFLGVLLGALTVLNSRISQPWQLYLLYGLAGVSQAFWGAPILMVVTRWFGRKRGLALGIASAGVGLGTLIGAPVSSLLITLYGWRDSFVIIGIAVGIVLLASAYFLRQPPPEGVEQAGSSESLPEKKPPDRSRIISPGQVLKSKPLYLIMLAYSLSTFSVRMVMIHVAPYAADIGIAASVAALVIGVIGGLSVAGRLLMGMSQDRIGPRVAMIICLSVQVASMSALGFINTELLLLVFAVFFGFAYGGDVPQVPAMVARQFGLTSMSLTYGLVMTITNIAGALGPIVAAYAFDLTGSYTAVFSASAAGVFVAVLCVLSLKAGSRLRA